MGFLKKIFKPVSKVLDKVLPNEIKPFLPYAAAFAPVIAPGIMGAFGNSMLGRAAMGGGLNIFGQLAQEGNEGDINLLSAGLGALTGAMTGPNAASDFKAMQSANKLQDANITRTALQKGMDLGLEGLAKGSDIFAAGMADPFSMAGLKAATLPAATATGDLMFAQAKRDQDEYDRMMEEDAASDAASDAQRAFAIRRAMEATGATEEEIEDAIYAAGYKTGGRVGFEIGGSTSELLEMFKERITDEPFKGEEGYIEEGIDMEKFKNSEPTEIESEETEEGLFKIKDQPIFLLPMDMKKGGRVGLRFGGIGAAVDQIDNQEMKEAAQFASMLNDMDVPIADLAEEFEIQFKRKPNSLEELKQFYKDRYDYKGPGDVKMKEEIKEKVVMGAKDGGRIGLQEGGTTSAFQQLVQQPQATQNAPMFLGRPVFNLQQAGAVFPRLNQLEQGVNRAEGSLNRIRNRLGEDQRQLSGLIGLQPALQPLNMLNLNRGMGISALQSGPEAQGMKDGGMMNLGGKEMDLRGGGFVPIGKKERADDVPARLSKNEFVMTADAVRAAGGGSVNEGAKRMYKVMNDLEARA
jgi:hypothetical protein